MIIFRNIDLKPYNTFGLSYRAGTLIRLKTETDARALFTGKINYKKPLLILGGGSNILFTEDFKGTIIQPEFSSVRIESLDKEDVIISAGSGVVWDTLVEWAVEMGFSGIENLSGIPGKVGAVPVQNIGAYGTEVKDLIYRVRTISTQNGRIRIFRKEECEFGYRTSIFKRSEKGNYLITRVYFRLALNHSPNLSYGSVKDEVEKLGKPTLKNIRKSILLIRQAKLPDPEITGNAGSFFKNPLLSAGELKRILKKYAGMPYYEESEGFRKIPAGWLIEQCGWKGYRSGDTGVHEKQALVLVNNGKAGGKEIFDLSEKIKESVEKKFGISLEREVEVI